MSTTNKSNGVSTAPNQQQRTITLRLPPSLSTTLTTVLTRTETHRNAVKSTFETRPLLSSFLLCQLLCSSVPIVLFLAGVAIAASLAASVFACVALLVVGPVLVFTSLLGVWVWAFCWAGWFIGRWVLGLGLFAEKNREVVVKEEEGKDNDNGLVVEKENSG